MTNNLDPEMFALAAMVRLTLREIALIKNPTDPVSELEEMRLRLVNEAKDRIAGGNDEQRQFHRTVVEAICALVPLSIDPPPMG